MVYILDSIRMAPNRARKCIIQDIVSNHPHHQDLQNGNYHTSRRDLVDGDANMSSLRERLIGDDVRRLYDR
jgi:hypothetical protein